MPHLRTDAGLDLELERLEDGSYSLRVYTDDVETGAEPGPRFYSIPAALTAAEARMIGAYLNPPPEPADGAELRARAAATARAKTRGTYDPTKTLPTNWRELDTYARHQAAKGLEVAIVVAAAIPELADAAGIAGVDVRVDPDLEELPGYFEVGRNGQRIARYSLAGSSARAHG